MANEFVARKGIISSGSINVSGSVTASYFKGDGSQLTNLPAATVLSSSVSIDTYTFNGDGSTKIFLLSQSYNVNSLEVFVDGLAQTNITDYTLSSATLTFVDTPPSASNILIKGFLNVTQNITGSFSGSFFGIVSTASYAQTASYALNAGAGSGFPFSGSAVITGSLLIVPTGNVNGITGSVSGALTGTFPYSGLTSVPSGIVSASTQVAPLLPNGTVSSSAQYPGWMTASSQVVWSQVAYNAGIVSSSTQVQPLLPANTVSSSAQVTAFLPTGTVSSSAQINTGSFSGSITSASYVSPSGLPAGTLSASSQVVWSQVAYNAGIVSSSGQVSYTGLSNIPVGIISSAAQVQPLLPNGTVSSSAQYPGWVTSSAQINSGSFTGSFTGSILASGVVSSSAQVVAALPVGTVSSSTQLPAGTVSSSTQIVWSSVNYNAGIVSSSAQVTSLLPAGTVSSSTQINTGSFSGSITSASYVSPSGLPTGTVSSSAQYPGWMTSSTQVVWSSVPYNANIVSSSAQTVANITGQTIAPSIINATGAISGASIQVSGNGTIGGNLTVTGTLTAASQSVQYISSSQLNVATNKIVVNTNQSLQFGGISVIDSGSANNTGSLYWDSVNNRWLYENISGQPYNSAIIVAGPPNYGSLGQERGLLIGRVPVATGDDHIDTAPQSSSIRVDYTSTKRVDIESGLFVTGSLTANGTVTLAGIPSSSAQVTALLPAGTVSASSQVDYNSITNKLSGVVSSSAQVAPLLPGGTVSSSAQYPGWVTSSAQVNTGSFTGSFIGAFTGSVLAPGVVSSSAQYPGWVTASSQIDYNSITNKLSGVVSSSTQVQPLLPVGTVSSSLQYPGWVTSSAQVNSGSFTGSFTGSLSAPSLDLGTFSRITANSNNILSLGTGGWASVDINSSIGNYIVNNIGNFAFSNSGTAGSINNTDLRLTRDGAGILAQRTGSNAQIFRIYNTYTSLANYERGKLEWSGNTFNIGTEASGSGAARDVSLQTSGSDRVRITSTGNVGINTITPNALLDVNGNVIITGSLTANGTVTLAGIPSSSTQVQTLLPGGTVSSSTQVVWASVPYSTGIVSASGQVQPLLPGGTVSSSAQYPGWITSSAQVVWSSVNYNSGILSSSTQFNALTGTSASYALTASYVANAVVGAGVVSSSTQFKTLTDPFTGSFTGSFTGTGAGLTNLPIAIQTDNYSFTGDGSTKNYILSQSYASSSVDVYVAGIAYTNITDYTISGPTASFITAPPNGSNILIKALLNTANAIGTFSGSYIGSAKLTGNVGINNSVPSASLHISGTTMIEQVIEKVNLTASAPPATFNVDLTSGSIFFRSASTAANWTLNFRGDTGTTLNSMMYNGQSITATVLVFNGATAYSASAYQIDGASVTPRWQGGTSGSANTNSLDAHQFTIIKVASASYHVLGSITKYT